MVDVASDLGSGGFVAFVEGDSLFGVFREGIGIGLAFIAEVEVEGAQHFPEGQVVFYSAA